MIKKNIIFYFIEFLLGIIIILFIAFVFINIYIINFSEKKIYSLNKLKNNKYNIALILGASVIKNKYPSTILKDRLDTAIKTYKLNKIKKIIVSGDNSKINYNEPIVMEKYLIKNGVKKKDIYLDYAGFDTYDSIFRAKEVFGVNRLIIFTQKYHLYRAIYIANKLGINSIGIISDKNNYKNIIFFKLREFFSRIKAFFEIEIFKTKPKFLGEKIKIKN